MKLIEYYTNKSIFNFVLEIRSRSENQDFSSLTIGIWGYYVTFRLPYWVLTPYTQHVKYDKYDYKILHPNIYGISICNNSVEIYYGPYTGDSLTSNYKFFEIPWMEYEYHSTTLYDINSNIYYTTNKKNWLDNNDYDNYIKTQPFQSFRFLDFDLSPRLAKCTLQRRIWTRGIGHFKWLKYIFPDINHLYLGVLYNEEVGPKKGSYKGGVLATDFRIESSNIINEFMKYAKENNFTNVELTAETFKDFRYEF